MSNAVIQNQKKTVMEAEEEHKRQE